MLKSGQNNLCIEPEQTSALKNNCKGNKKAVVMATGLLITGLKFKDTGL